jgi:hypothetical protein
LRSLLTTVLIGLSTHSARAAECSNAATCKTSSGADADIVQLRDGRALCGTVVHQERDRYVIIVTADATRTVSWDDVQCLTSNTRAAQPEPTRARAASVETGAMRAEPEPHWGGLALDWDIRLIGSGLWKRYADRGVAAWSWGAGGGVGLGTALHLRTAAALNRSRGISWFDFELGITDAVSFGNWRQVNRSAAAMVEQDTSLVLGTRLALGKTQTIAGVQHWSGVMVGIAWIPTYVDFFGSAITSKGTINPAGIRLTADFGSAAGPDLGHSPLLRIALSWLPYVGHLPTALSIGVGLVFY